VRSEKEEIFSLLGSHFSLLKFMPIYEYKCVDCGTHLEKMQKISDEPLKVCEACGGKLEKQVSRTGFQFKGEGWYVTDYAGKKNNGAAEKGAEKSSTGESTAKTESASKEKSDSSAKETTSKKD
jgi:putative FmdB family regulatory protein